MGPRQYLERLLKSLPLSHWSHAVAVLAHTRAELVSDDAFRECLQMCLRAEAPHGAARVALHGSRTPIGPTLTAALPPEALALFRDTAYHMHAGQMCQRKIIELYLRDGQGDPSMAPLIPQHLLHRAMAPSPLTIRQRLRSKTRTAKANLIMATKGGAVRGVTAEYPSLSATAVKPMEPTHSHPLREALHSRLDNGDLAGAQDLVRQNGYRFMGYESRRRYLKAICASPAAYFEHAKDLLRRGARFSDVWKKILLDVMSTESVETSLLREVNAEYLRYLRWLLEEQKASVVTLVEELPSAPPTWAQKVAVLDTNTIIEVRSGKVLAASNTLFIVPVSTLAEFDTSKKWQVYAKNRRVWFLAPSVEIYLRGHATIKAKKDEKISRVLDDSILEVCMGLKSLMPGPTEVTLLTENAELTVRCGQEGIHAERMNNRDESTD